MAGISNRNSLPFSRMSHQPDIGIAGTLIRHAGWQYAARRCEPMNIRHTIAAINQMQADGVIERYAIGGAVGATFYLDPVATLDVDVFHHLSASSRPVCWRSPHPVFDYLKRVAAEWKANTSSSRMAGAVPPPPRSAWSRKRWRKPSRRTSAGMSARVFTAEHLAAIALQTGRAKDKARLLQFIESGTLDAARFQAILSRHGLTAAWNASRNSFWTTPHDFDLARILKSKREFRQRLAPGPSRRSSPCWMPCANARSPFARHGPRRKRARCMTNRRPIGAKGPVWMKTKRGELPWAEAGGRAQHLAEGTVVRQRTRLAEVTLPELPEHEAANRFLIKPRLEMGDPKRERHKP